ncbi:DUF6985 domain-containing protein [Luxibacter massiliensis]|uniref:DUF6985 domain-containing protein n=1 Tax=Luxibacter massiliensis TaxID=2219695 RepID=UPI000F068FA4|nr:hypothetical protein [Luxibacter massiliensis]
MRYLEPEKNEIMDIWGRQVQIKVIFDLFQGEDISEQQGVAYDKFYENKEKIFETSYAKLKEYCLENYSDKVDKNFINIYSYVIPKSLYIKREKNDKRTIGFFCKFRFDKENDLVVLIENEEIVKIGTQDIIL